MAVGPPRGGFPHLLIGDMLISDFCLIVNIKSAFELVGLTIFFVILGKKRKETVCIALITEEEGAEDKHILMNKVVRRNLRVRMGDIVSVHPCPNDVPNATKIHVLPFSDSIEGITGNITQTYLIPYFKDCYRPVKKGDTFIVRQGFRPIEFKIVDVDPPEYGIVSP